MNNEWKRLARGLVGSPARLRVIAYLASRDDSEWVRQEDVRDETGLRQPEVNRLMVSLHRLGLLRELRQPPHGWPHYQRTPSDLWDALASVAHALDKVTKDSYGAANAADGEGR